MSVSEFSNVGHTALVRDSVVPPSAYWKVFKGMSAARSSRRSDSRHRQGRDTYRGGGFEEVIGRSDCPDRL